MLTDDELDVTERSAEELVGLHKRALTEATTDSPIVPP